MTLARVFRLGLLLLASCTSSSPLGLAQPDAGNDTAPDALALTPRALGQRLVFWFDPTSLVVADGKVTRWKDLSDSGNDAVQPAPDLQPSFTASSIAGLPTATLGGPVTFLRLYDNPSLQWGHDDFVVLAIERATAATTALNAMLYHKTAVAPYDGASLYLNPERPVPTKLAGAAVSDGTYAVSTAPPATFVDANVHLLGIRRAGSTLEVRVDGALSGSLTSPKVASTDVSAPGLDAIIGHNGYAPRPEAQQVHGEIAEMLAVRGAVSDAEVAGLEQYLIARYRRTHP